MTHLPAPSAPAVARLRILVVEDDPVTLDVMLEMLGELGHWATGVGSAEAARMRYLEGAFDVLMTDVGLPALSGLDLAESLHGGGPAGVRVLFASAHPAPQPPLPEGCAWLEKPFRLGELAQALAGLAQAAEPAAPDGRLSRAQPPTSTVPAAPLALRPPAGAPEPDPPAQRAPAPA